MMKQENPSRRTVLRGALALGCTLLAPMTLSGCDSKKGEGTSSPAPSSPAPSSTPDSSMTPAAPAATSKMTQASVQYQAQPKGDQRCANCLHFIPESNTCKLVEGQVSPEGWCIVWAKQA